MNQLKIGIIAITAEGASKAFRDLNNAFYKKQGKYKNPDILMTMQPLSDHVSCFGDKNRWTALLQESVDILIAGGASMIWMPANSSHLSIDQVDFKGIPFINMVDIASQHLNKEQKKTLVMGTSVSMSDALYFKHTTGNTNLRKLNASEQEKLDKIILEELILGTISDESRHFIKETITSYKAKGVEKAFFACTELPCFFSPNEFDIPVEDSINISINKIIDDCF